MNPANISSFAKAASFNQAVSTPRYLWVMVLMEAV
jgi:hypothetical protein